MGRLIDADEFMYKIASIAKLAKSDKQKELMGRIMYCLDKQPTAYNVDKVVAELEKYKSTIYSEAGECWEQYVYLDTAQKIVRKGGVE